VVTSVINAIELGLFIAVGVVGIIAFYATLVVVFRQRRRQGSTVLVAAVVALLLACLMVGLWPFYGIYWLWKRSRSHD
jgi:uncharacterized membrane protein